MTSLSRPSTGLGHLSCRLERFLLRTVQENTSRRYTSLLASFKCELERRKIPWANLDEEHRGIFLAEYILGCHGADICSLQESNCLAAALQNIMPPPSISYRMEDTPGLALRCAREAGTCCAA